MTRICIFGDSIAWGSRDTKEGGWATMLKKDFAKLGQFNQVYNLAISGTYSPYILKQMKVEINHRMEKKYKKKHTIIISTGVNDSKLVKNIKALVNLNDFESNLVEMISLSKEYSKKIIMIGLTPVDESRTNPLEYELNSFYKNKRIKAYNKILKKICEKAGIPFVDIFNKWLKMDYKDLLFDGLHPNSKGHKVLYQDIREMLKKESVL